ncbi:MAG: hypothetical protein WD944_06940 [Steroidobacteraceae bacterium]
MAIAIALSAALLIVILFLRQSRIISAPSSPQPVGGTVADAGHTEPNSLPSHANGGEKQALFKRPKHYEEFDFRSILRASLEEAALG